MPRTYSKPKTPRYRPKSEAQKQRHREEVEKAGGWYNWHKQQREEREHQQHEAEARQTPQSRTDRIVTYPQRRYVGEPPRITKEGE